MAENVKVAVRVRPFNGREKDRKAKNCIEMDGPKTSIVDPDTKKKRNFVFDYSYDSFVPRDNPKYAGQLTVWNDIGVGVLANAYDGYNCSLFAYGQTGAGKSYSMMGYGPDKGIIPMAMERIFDRIDDNEDKDLTFRVETSMLEIYMEKIRDLFNPKAGDNLKIRNNPKTGFYVEKLTRSAVGNFKMVEQLMEMGSKARTVASTQMNATSSRAHTIFQVVLTQTIVNRDTGKATDKTALINLIDLAGSERQSGTGATGARLKEGSAINLSLSSLGNCISALAHNASGKKKRRVPFRDSVLTMLLKNSLGGNAKTIMIAAVSPADINYDETLGTLRYADRAKQIKNKAIVNEDPNEKMIRALKGEIDELKRKLAMGGAGAGAGAGVDLSAMEDEMRAKFEKEKEEEMARMKAELQEKLREEAMQGMSWDERIKMTQAQTASNNAVLVSQGAMASDEAREKAKTVPHMFNLNEDPQMSGQIIHFFDENKPLKIGRSDADEEQDVKLRGLSIMNKHCTITNSGGGNIVLAPIGTAKTHHNGELVNGNVTLSNNDRLIFGSGSNYVFKVLVPGADDDGGAGEGKNDEAEGADFTWEHAMMEMNKAQVQMMAEQEAKRRAAADAATAEAAEKVAKLEAEMEAQRKAAAEEAEKNKRFFEEREAEMKRQAEALAAQAANAQTSKELEEKLQEQEAAMRAQAEAAEAKYKTEQEEMKRKAEELERKLQAQIKETERHARQQQRDMRERSLLDEKLLKTIPLVNEANAISDELGKMMSFSVKLMANPNKQRTILFDSDAESSEDEEEEADTHHLDTAVFVRVEFTDESAPVTMWSHSGFMDRLFLMRELYTTFIECGRDLAAAQATMPTDPFYVKPEAQLIGRATIYLDSLLHLLGIHEDTPVYDYKGKEEGQLKVRCVPHLSEEAPTTEEEEEAQDFGTFKLSELRGHKLGITIFIDKAQGLPATRCTGVFVRYKFFYEDKSHETKACPYRTINPTIEYKHTFWPVVTEELEKYVNKEGLVFEVYGNMDGEASRPPTAAAVAGGPSREELDKLREQLSTAATRTEQVEAELAARVKAAEEERETLRRELEAAKRAQVANATSQGAAAASATVTPGADAAAAEVQRLAREKEEAEKKALAEKKKREQEVADLQRQLAAQQKALEEARTGSKACIIL